MSTRVADRIGETGVTDRAVPPSFYAGQPPLNRLSFHRNDTQRMTEHLNAAQARFVLFRDGKPLLKLAGAEGKYDGLYFAEYKEVEGYVKDRSFA